MVARPQALMILVVILAAAAGALTPPALAAFQPGHVYVPGTFQPGTSPPGRIFEVNPATGSYRVFAEFPTPGGVPRSLVFTPDGQYLRAYHNGEIFQINGDGQIVESYSQRTGVSCSGRPNAMAFAPNGDFFVSTGFIRRVPGDQPPSEIFPGSELLLSTPSIAFGPDGTLFAADSRRLYRFAPDGTRMILDEQALAPPVGSGPTLGVDDDGVVYVRTVQDGSRPSGIYRYRPETFYAPELFLRTDQFEGETPLIAMTYSRSSGRLYYASGRIINEINVATGEVRRAAFVDYFPSYLGGGIAVYVPEPSAGFVFLLSLLATCITRNARR